MQARARRPRAVRPCVFHAPSDIRSRLKVASVSATSSISSWVQLSDGRWSNYLTTYSLISITKVFIPYFNMHIIPFNKNTNYQWFQFSVHIKRNIQLLRLRWRSWPACCSNSCRVWKSMRVRDKSNRLKHLAFFNSPKPRWSTLEQLAMLNSKNINTIIRWSSLHSVFYKTTRIYFQKMKIFKRFIIILLSLGEVR